MSEAKRSSDPILPPLERNIQHVLLSQVIDEVFPHLAKTGISDSVAQVVSSLHTCAHTNVKGDDYGIVRGGVARRFLLGERPYEKEIKQLGRLLLPVASGNEVYTKAVQHAFGDEMDCDISIRRNKAVPLTRYVDSIKKGLENSGYVQVSGVNDMMSNGKYCATLIQEEIGFREKSPMFTLLFQNPQTGKIDFTLSLTDHPDNEMLSKDDIRGFADTDLLTRMHISNVHGQPIVAYDREALLARFHNYYFALSCGPFRFDSSLVPRLAEFYRECASRATYIEDQKISLGWGFFTHPLLFALYHDLQIPIPKEQVSAMTLFQHDEIRAREIPMLSDILYSFVTNPVLSIALAHIHNFLDIVPIGQILSQHNATMDVLDLLYKKVGLHPLSSSFNMFPEAYRKLQDPLLLIDVMKELQLIPSETPKTTDSLMGLLHPLK